MFFYYIKISDDTNIATTAISIKITITFFNFSFMITPQIKLYYKIYFFGIFITLFNIIL